MPDDNIMLLTGIDELDELFGKASGAKTFGMACARSACASVNIVGTDGTGKSTLAFHIASNYHAIYGAGVMYFSEDCSHSRAKTYFDDFGLTNPQQRYEALYKVGNARMSFDNLVNPTVEPQERGPGKDQRFKRDDRGKFLYYDLQSDTAGDDWTFALEEIAKTERATQIVTPCTHNLIVIDNVDAFQMANAGVDMHGNERSRWSRLDQLFHIAKGRCHVLLISGEPVAGTRLNEQYACDYVLRLYTSSSSSKYQSRVLEVEKARGQVNVRGPHFYSIRSGDRTTTGFQENPDNPEINLAGKRLCHFKVFQSLDYLYSKILSEPWSGYTPGSINGPKRCFSCLPKLNELFPTESIPGGNIACVIGPRHSYKRAFVSSIEADVFPNYEQMKEETAKIGDATINSYFESNSDDPANAYFTYRNKVLKDVCQSESRVGDVAIVHISTEDVTSWQVADRVTYWLHTSDSLPARTDKTSEEFDVSKPAGQKLISLIESRVFCRRLEIHSNSAEILFQTIKGTVEHAIRSIPRYLGYPESFGCDERSNASKIVVFIGDWEEIRLRNPEAVANPNFLPLLVFWLRRLGVCCIFTESHIGVAALPNTLQRQSSIAIHADQEITLWRVQDDARLAVMVAPQGAITEGRLVVREVVRPLDKSPRISVDSSLERYQGFVIGKPVPVPLHVQLIAQTPAQERYATELEALLRMLYDPEFKIGRIVTASKGQDYRLLHDAVYVSGDAHLDYSQLMLVDEFWDNPSSLMSLNSYLTHTPFKAQAKEMFENKARCDVFAKCDAGNGQIVAFDTKKSTRVPYTWDFGFILTRPDAWRVGYRDVVPIHKRMSGNNLDIRAYSNMLRFTDALLIDGKTAYVRSKMRLGKDKLYGRKEIGCDVPVKPDPFQINLLGWRVFLETCQAISRMSPGMNLKAFDIDLTAPEALSACFLEIWWSEIRWLKHIRFDVQTLLRAKPSSLTVNTSTPVAPDAPLVAHLLNPLEGFAFWLAVQMLSEVLDSDSLAPAQNGVDVAARPPFPAVAVRHWYTTATRAVQEDAVTTYTPMRLPGHYSVRGDWYLAAARGSKSQQLVYDAIDLMSSRRANFDRLQAGVGLPARSLEQPTYLRTALATANRSTAISNATLGNLAALGADLGDDPSFNWLMRGQIKYYARTATVFRKSIFRTLNALVGDRKSGLRSDANAFAIYDCCVSPGASEEKRRYYTQFWEFYTTTIKQTSGLLEECYRSSL